MKRKRKAILNRIYSKIPEANCKGLCQSACTMIGFTKLEAQAMITISGKEPFLTEDAACGYLLNDRCSVYEARPAICRLYGVTEKLKCEHGCVPDRMIPDSQSMQILKEIDMLSDGKMYSNITKLQALNIRLGNELNSPLSLTKPSIIIPIVDKNKTD